MSKAVKEVKDFAKNPVKETVKLIEKASEPVIDTLRSTGHIVEAGYDVMKGDFKEAQKDFVKATGEITKATINTAMLGTGEFIAPKLLETSKQGSEMVANYATGNFNRGSQNLENITGWDVDNSIAEAEERAAREAYQAEVDAANEAEARNRRANLLSLRKSLTPSLSRSSQGGTGGGAAQTIKGLGGIVLG